MVAEDGVTVTLLTVGPPLANAGSTGTTGFCCSVQERMSAMDAITVATGVRRLRISGSFVVMDDQPSSAGPNMYGDRSRNGDAAHKR